MNDLQVNIKVLRQCSVCYLCCTLTKYLFTRALTFMNYWIYISEIRKMSSGNKTSAQAQQKFTNLRKRLDQLGYRQTLGLESLPLVEKLFADLVHTTESLKNTKLQLGKTEVESKDVDSAIEPYKSDNAKLVKENNDLHQQIIKQKDESDAIVRGSPFYLTPTYKCTGI